MEDARAPGEIATVEAGETTQRAVTISDEYSTVDIRSHDREEELARMLFAEIGSDSSRLSRFIRAFTRLQRAANVRGGHRPPFDPRK